MDFKEQIDYVREEIFNSWSDELKYIALNQSEVYNNTIDYFINIIIDTYISKNRHYHNIEHITTMLKRFEQDHKSFTKHQISIMKSAIIFHDFFYDPFLQNGENEDISSNYAKKFYSYFLPNAYVKEISQLIIYTNYNMFPIGYKLYYIFNNYIRDLDIHNFGDSTLEETIERQLKIRREFQLVPLNIWAKNTVMFLDNILSKEKIYQTKYFKNLETQARENIIGLKKNIIETPEIFR